MLTTCNLQVADEAAVPDVAEISFTEFPFPSKTSTKARSKSSLFPSQSSVRPVTAEVASRAPFRPVPVVKVEVSRSCSVSSAL